MLESSALLTYFNISKLITFHFAASFGNDDITGIAEWIQMSTQFLKMY